MKIVVPGKWILTGEHAVVRGSPAIVSPLPSLTLSLESTTQELDLSNPLQIALNKIIATMQSPPEEMKKLLVTSSIPLRAGLGSSAALSVAVARYLNEKKIIFADDIMECALDFENIFHGTSSGLDLAAVSGNGPIYFRKETSPIPLEMNWKPKIFLHDTHTRSSTKECVEHVATQKREDLDQLMKLSVETARMALRLDESSGAAMLQDAILTAAKCFKEWRLMNSESIELEAALYSAGALAVKPTGSGNGGFLLSFWNQDPPKDLQAIPAF